MPEVVQTPVDITQTTFGAPPPVDMSPSPSPIMTTAQVNGSPEMGGSVDGGGHADQVCAWWVSQRNPHYAAMAAMQAANQQAADMYGRPFYVPSLVQLSASSWAFALGGLYGGFHGWKRSKGKWGPTLGYGLLTAVSPFIGVGVSLFQGPFSKRRG